LDTTRLENAGIRCCGIEEECKWCAVVVIVEAARAGRGEAAWAATAAAASCAAGLMERSSATDAADARSRYVNMDPDMIDGVIQLPSATNAWYRSADLG
jgi:hypothetical protein